MGNNGNGKGNGKKNGKKKSAKLEKRPNGRPPKKINFKTFEELCKIQCTEQEICNVLDININTLNTKLKEHYGGGFSYIFKRFADYGKMSLRRAQFRMAMQKQTMAIWLGKQYLNQKDKVEIDALEMFKEKLEVLPDDKPLPENRIAEFIN